MATVALDGFEMYYEVRGEGEPLLLLHGGMGIGDDWRHIFPSDPEGYRVIVPDLRGHGRSTSPAEGFTFRQCANDVRSLLEHLGISQVKSIGLSMGAKTLLHLATAHPARVDAMVLVSATPSFPQTLRTAGGFSAAIGCQPRTGLSERKTSRPGTSGRRRLPRNQ